VPVKINVSEAQIAGKLNSAWDKSLAIMTEEIMNDMNQYVKVDTHALEQSAITHSVPSQGLIIWQTPYARRQYWEIETAHTDINPNATWQWGEVAKQQCSDKWAAQAQRLVEMNL
jgi:hypothetical protein